MLAEGDEAADEVGGGKTRDPVVIRDIDGEEEGGGGDDLTLGRVLLLLISFPPPFPLTLE